VNVDTIARSVSKVDWLDTKVTGRPALMLCSSDEPGELLQWQCPDDSTINIVICIIIIRWLGGVTVRMLDLEVVGSTPSQVAVKWLLLGWVTVCGQLCVSVGSNDTVAHTHRVFFFLGQRTNSLIPPLSPSPPLPIDVKDVFLHFFIFHVFNI